MNQVHPSLVTLQLLDPKVHCELFSLAYSPGFSSPFSLFVTADCVFFSLISHILFPSSAAFILVAGRGFEKDLEANPPLLILSLAIIFPC